MFWTTPAGPREAMMRKRDLDRRIRAAVRAFRNEDPDYTQIMDALTVDVDSDVEWDQVCAAIDAERTAGGGDGR